MLCEQTPAPFSPDPRQRELTVTPEILAPQSVSALRAAELQAGAPLLEAIEVVLSERFEKVCRLLPVVVQSKSHDIEPVHRLRVATRRLSAALDTLAEGVPVATRKMLDGVLGKIRRSCGEARGLDVERISLERLLDHAESTDLAVADLLCERAVRRRERLHPALTQRMKREISRLDAAGTQLLTAVAELRLRKQDDYGTFGEAANRILHRELMLLSLRTSIATASVGALHRLRLDCKHLRYATEIFLPVLGPEFERTLYPRVVEIQDVLGTFRDATLAEDRYRAVRDKWKTLRRKSRWRRKPQALFTWRELKSGLKFVRNYYRDQAATARARFEELWPRFIGDAFCEPFDLLLHRDQSDTPCQWPTAAK